MFLGKVMCLRERLYIGIVGSVEFLLTNYIFNKKSMNKKTLGVVGALVVLVVGVMAFGNFPGDDAAGRASKVMKGDDGKAGMEKMVAKDGEMRMEERVALNEDVKGLEKASDEDISLQDWCEEDYLDANGDRIKGGDGISDNVMGYEMDGDIVTPIPLAVEDCEEWTENQVASDGDETGGEPLPYDDDCFQSCIGNLGNVPPHLHGPIMTGCEAQCRN